MSVKVHLSKVTERPGYTKTGSLCGRLSNRLIDGMNVTVFAGEVTCQFCLRLMERPPARVARS